MADARTALAREAARRRLETVLFGLVARFERGFGGLWGHGKLPVERTDEEAAWAGLWARVRKDCLDHGHREARGLDAELAGAAPPPADRR